MSRKIFDIIEFLLLLGIIVFLNIIFSYWFFRIDLTEDKRYSISPATKAAVASLTDQMFIEVFLDGELTPDYVRLKKAIQEKLNELRLFSDNKIEYRFTDPNAIEDKRLREQFFAQLIQKGVQYKYERTDQGGSVEEKMIFPSAIISYQGKENPVMFLKGSKILPLQEQLNQSVEGVEYELMASVRKLNNKVVKSLAFIEGHGEFPKENLADISSALSEYYNVDRITLNASTDLRTYQAIIIAGPTQRFSDQEKFILDQFVVNGGSLLVFVDALNLNADSLTNGYTFAFPYNTGLEDLLFKFGVRINTNLIQDLNAGILKVETGNSGQTEMVNWPFYPIIYNYGHHPIVKNLDAIMSRYAGNIDTIKAEGITKTPLLLTTANTKLIQAPARLDLNETRVNVDPKSFNKGVQCIGYLLEGKFESVFKNRASPISGRSIVSLNKPSRVIVCSDGDIIKNETDKIKKQPIPLGYDANIKYEFSNRDFILHSADYLMGEDIINVRNKEIALRPLDKIILANEKFFWQVVNLILPVILIIIFGVARHIYRKRKYEST